MWFIWDNLPSLLEGSGLICMMSCYIVNYLLSLLVRFSLICGSWAFPIIHVLWDKQTGLSFCVGAWNLGVPLGWPLPWAWRVGL